MAKQIKDKFKNSKIYFNHVYYKMNELSKKELEYLQETNPILFEDIDEEVQEEVQTVNKEEAFVQEAVQEVVQKKLTTKKSKKK